jgi:hypothetical protein
MTEEKKQLLVDIIRDLTEKNEKLLEMQQFEEIELDSLSSQVNAAYAEELEENAAILDESVFFVDEAIKNLKCIPGIAEIFK